VTELFLIVLIVSMLALALGVVTFALAMRRADAAESVSPAGPVHTLATEAPPFFADSMVTSVTTSTSRAAAVSPEALVPRIERHIHLEHAAAEAFLERPTEQSLHSRTASPLLRARETIARSPGNRFDELR
jgi:hypothetical protein